MSGENVVSGIVEKDDDDDESFMKANNIGAMNGNVPPARHLS